eukprot:12885151-Heterocapsa_arctica.AAC.1
MSAQQTGSKRLSRPAALVLVAVEVAYGGSPQQWLLGAGGAPRGAAARRTCRRGAANAAAPRRAACVKPDGAWQE